MTHTSTEQPWWRKHTDEIELKVARGEVNAATCFTKMLWLVSEASQAQRVAWENLPSYLIDHCEGDIISEEGLQRALSNMLTNPQYSAHGITQEKQG